MFRTSVLYNSRFFRKDKARQKICPAGSKDGIQILHDGSIVRCSTNQSKVSHIGNYDNLFDSTTVCSIADSCYCEWHHYNEWTLANDNDVWNRYIEAGIWQAPSLDDLYMFVKKMDWDESGRNIEGIASSIFDEV